MAILGTGGAGYIGSVTVERLRQTGEETVVLDDLARGHRATVDPAVPFYQGRIGDRQLLERITKEHKIDSCIHFAALAYVGESMEKPASYFENNVEQGLAFIRALIEAGVRRLVFSSTCATYGEPQEVPIREQTPQWPKNPYGWSKLILERALDSYDQAYGLKFVALRYLNACGATAKVGENHDPEPHLIPNVLAACAGKLKRGIGIRKRLSDTRWHCDSGLRTCERPSGGPLSCAGVFTERRNFRFHQPRNGDW